MSTDLPGFPTSKHTTVGGHDMAYVDEGAGRPVLLVHGNPTWSFYYRSLLTALPPLGLRVIAPDHIGMGRSAKPSAADYPHTLSRRVADLGELIDSLHLDEPLSLVVHDWGGAIALAWAVDHPDQVDKLVLLNTGAFPLPPEKSMPWTLTAARLPGFGDFAVRRLNAFSLGALTFGTGGVVVGAEARKGLLAPYDSPAHRVAVAEFVKDIPLKQTDPAWATLKHTEDTLRVLEEKPTLVCWGMKDPVFDGVVLEHLLSFLPKADVHRFDKAGHYVLEDVPEQIVPLVTAFLG